MTIKKLLPFLACPNCTHPKLIHSQNNLTCPHCHYQYPIVNQIPILTLNQKFNYQETSQQKIFNKHYSNFSQTSYSLENWRISMLNRLFRHSFLPKIKTLLDIGCGGTGYVVIESSRKLHSISIGVDISLTAVTRAQKMAAINHLSSQTGFVVASAQNLPFKKETFDYISLVSTLEHFANDHNVISQVKNILNRRGFVFICVPNAFKFLPFFIWPFYFLSDRLSGHQRHYSLSHLQSLFGPTFVLKTKIYNGHLLKFWQLFLDKLKLISSRAWWQLERHDLNQNNHGVQLNAIFQKK